ncbi:hypothetical protein [Pedobacter immunditicola]|uniref:hypothetical protein n=1 Tax=Pedobacter immunditicola TaxID=3133440 RepID=UPI00309D4C89
MAYGIKYKCAFSSIKGLKYQVYILKKDYDSAIIEIENMGATPVEINYTSNSENKFEIIRGSECILNIYSDFDGQFSEIMVADAKEYQVQVWLNDTLHWQGYVIQDNYSEPFQSAPYLISLRATDGLGDLKFLDFTAENGSPYLTDMTFAEAILNCLGKLKNGSQLITSNDVLEARIDRNDLKNEAFNNLTVNPFIFLEDDLNTLKCDEVLKMILELFQCYIYYKKGKYHIERVNYKLNDVITRRTYSINFDGIQDSTNPTVNNENIRSEISKTSGLSFINADHNITYVPAYNKVQIENNVTDPNNLLHNNYFRNWDSSNTSPLSWVKSGNISIGKKDFTRSGSALHILTKVEDNAISYTTNRIYPIRNAFVGSKNKRADDKLTITIANQGNVRFMVKATTVRLGTHYLYCERDTEVTNAIQYKAEFKGATPSFCKIPAPESVVSGTDEWFVNSLEVLLPVDTVTLDIAFLPSFTATYNQDCIIREFTVAITAGTSARAVGDVYSITSDKNVRETNSDLQPTLGEFGDYWYSNQILLKSSTSKLPTANWYREGKTESKPLFQLCSQAILNQYRTPFKLFSGSFYGAFDFAKVYEIQHLIGLYMPYKSSSDLKLDLHKVDFFELLNDADVATDKAERNLKYKDGDYSTISNEIVPRRQRAGGRN